MKVICPILFGFMALMGVAASGQHTVNPGRPSFSENNHIIAAAALQAENGLSSTEIEDQMVYGFNSLFRMGFHSRWEGRVFSGVEMLSTQNEERISSIACNGVGAGLKFLWLEETQKRPGAGFLAQTSISPEQPMSHSLNILLTKEFSSLAFDLNANSIFNSHHFASVSYIVCAGYSLGKAAIFIEGMVNDNRHTTDELWIQGGAAWNINDRWQIDIAAASFGNRFSSQMFQLGFSFLTISKKHRTNRIRSGL